MGEPSSVTITAGPAEAGFVDRGSLGGAKAEEGGQASAWRWRNVFGATWSVLSWGGWAVMAVVKVLHAMLALAMLQANLTVRRTPFGRGVSGVCFCHAGAAQCFSGISFLRSSNLFRPLALFFPDGGSVCHLWQSDFLFY